jgi:cellobiose transport system permease protein
MAADTDRTTVGRTTGSAGLAIGSGSRLTRIAVRVALLPGVLVSLFPGDLAAGATKM